MHVFVKRTISSKFQKSTQITLRFLRSPCSATMSKHLVHHSEQRHRAVLMLLSRGGRQRGKTRSPEVWRATKGYGQHSLFLFTLWSVKSPQKKLSIIGAQG